MNDKGRVLRTSEVIARRNEKAVKKFFAANPNASKSEAAFKLGLHPHTIEKHSANLNLTVKGKGLIAREKVKAFYDKNPDATQGEAAAAVGLSQPRVNRIIKALRDEARAKASEE